MKKKTVLKTSLIVCLIAVSVIAILPVAVMLFDSFKTGAEIAENSWGLPHKWTLENYRSLISYNSGIMVRTFLNSLGISTVYTILTMIVASLAAFAFSKYRFRGNKTIFFLLLVTMMIPGEITLPAIYLMFSKAHMLNTYSVQIFPGIANVFCLFMLKQYMDGMPDSLLEAARIDGAGEVYTFRKIMIPICKPTLGALAILTFLGKWNDYLWPSMLLTKKEVMPIMVILPTLNTSNSTYSIPWELILTGCTIVTVPLIVVFLIFQEQFMASVTLGAVKE